MASLLSYLTSSFTKTADEDEDFVIIPPPQRQMQDGMPEVFKLPELNGVDLYEITVAELQQHFANGTFTAVGYVKYCLEQIRKTNPYLECVIETNPDAVEIAASLDAERKQGKLRGPLHGIPILIKDNIATADKQQTTCGSWALLGCKVPRDAHVVHRLREAGAVVIGKSNLDEWAGARSHTYSAGWSGRGGQCRNAYILRRSPHGSSSGSAVAVTSNLVPLALGTETDCSVISPGMVNGVVSIKPTVGLTSRAGVIPVSETQDSVGMFGRTVADAALALDAAAGPDADDEFSTANNRWQPKGGYHTCLVDRHALKGAVFGLPQKRFWLSVPKRQRKAAERVLYFMEEAGAKIVPVDIPCAEERLSKDGVWDWQRHSASNPAQSEITVMKTQMYYLMQRYLSTLTNTPIRTIEDIVGYNNKYTGAEGGTPGTLPAFPGGQDLFDECIATKGVKTPEYRAALKHITSQCRENGIDAALTLTSATQDQDAPPKTHFDALLFCDVKRGGIQIAAQAGYPVVGIPVGLDPDGMPVALTFQHTAWRDDLCLKWASAVEDLLRHIDSELGCERAKRVGRVPPMFMDHLAKNVPVENCYRYPVVSFETSPPEAEVGDASGKTCGGTVKPLEKVEEPFSKWPKCRYIV